MYVSTARTWAAATAQMESARCGGLYNVKASPRLMSREHVEKGDCPCDGTHWTIMRERKPERVSPRGIASEAIARQKHGVGAEPAGPAERIGEDRVRPFRPRKKHYRVSGLTAEDFSAPHGAESTPIAHDMPRARTWDTFKREQMQRLAVATRLGRA